MTFIQRLQAEEANTFGDIFLYEDGSKFIKAHERSAYMFCQVFKPMVRMVSNNKEYGGPYVTIGFPKEQRERYASHEGYTYSRRKDGNIVIHTFTRKEPVEFPEADFQAWKGKAVTDKAGKKGRKQKPADDDIQTPPAEALPAAATSADSSLKLIISDIMQQPLADYTPMRALNYLNTLQERIRNEGLSD